MKNVKFEHFIGEQAILMIYIYWDMQLKMNTIRAVYHNLEIIVTNCGNIVAHRSDHPVDMRHMVKNDGEWCTTDQAKILSKADLCRLELLMMECKWN